MNTDAAPKKFTLRQLRERHHFDIPALARSAAVSTDTVYGMLLGDPVPHDEAVAVLNAFSEDAGEAYTLDTVEVCLATPLSAVIDAQMAWNKPSFRALRNKHWFDVVTLAEKAMLPPNVVIAMILNEPVPREAAVKVLVAYNEAFSEHYTLDVLDVKIS